MDVYYVQRDPKVELSPWEWAVFKRRPNHTVSRVALCLYKAQADRIAEALNLEPAHQPQ